MGSSPGQAGFPRAPGLAHRQFQAADLRQAAAIIASFVYNAATRPDLLPRKPLPAAPQLPAGRAGGSN